ncbi:HAD-IIA family hydrolase [Halorubrum sp. JWXQ-INN 858]|uniref:HAD-IIA family hydrolase n=1 Tax=Halorubrum sp. JWXQ-INN 858 TaxID=2690782 RepID=UPI00135A4937|nr:HAD-IIA family hydrolase [Halorubrum sp. JWXQ-INN 858]MWV64083.1 HAD-IIA family hydrolase [Halorubrum sp. JWXQ-INN 858]
MSRLRGALIDLDGTVYLGDELLPGVVDGIDALEEAGVEPVFLSNNATKRPAQYREKLAGFGIDVPADSVRNSAAIAAAFLADRHPDAGVYVIGEPALVAELRAAGLDVVTRPEDTDVVLASMDLEFGQDALQDVLDADRQGEIAIYATNPDRTCPVEDGEIPDCGAVIGAIEGLLGREIDGVLGKPSRVTIDVALDRLGMEPDECVMIGDRLGTDIRMGKRAGMRTALVLTGVTDRAAVEAHDVEPDHVLDSLADAGQLVDDRRSTDRP